jgi:hypothetical protein
MDDRRREWILLATRPSGGRFTTTAKGNRLCATREPAPESGKVVDNNHLIVRRAASSIERRCHLPVIGWRQGRESRGARRDPVMGGSIYETKNVSQQG